MSAVVILLPLLWSGLIALILILVPVAAGLGTPDAPQVPVAAVPPALVTATRPVAAGPTTALEFLAFANGAGARSNGADAFLDEIETVSLRLVNEERLRAKLPPLLLDDRLSAAARAHSRDMLVRGFFDHVSPEGLTPADRIAGVHRRHIGTSGENIWGQTGANGGKAGSVAALAIKGLMASPGHRENILRETFTHIGVGAAGDGQHVRLTQLFGGRKALLDSDLPAMVRVGTPLALAATPSSADTRTRGRTAERFALFAADRGQAVQGPDPIANAVVRAAPGIYRLQLYFSETGGWTIAFGPDLKVAP